MTGYLIATASKTSAAASSESLLSRAFHTVLVWQERVSMRRRLAQLDHYQLTDIGMNEDAVNQEIEKPFWKA